MTSMKHENIIEPLGEAHARDGGDGEERLQHRHRDWHFASASALHLLSASASLRGMNISIHKARH
jgi:hypothetical protein